MSNKTLRAEIGTRLNNSIKHNWTGGFAPRFFIAYVEKLVDAAVAEAVSDFEQCRDFLEVQEMIAIKRQVQVREASK